MDTGDIPSIKALVVVDGDGKRIVSRYYKADLPTLADEHAFEKKLFEKTMRTNAKNEGALACLAASHPVPSPARARAPALARADAVSPFRAAEIIMFDNQIVVYRNSCDVWFYVVGSQTENELILVNALMALYDALSSVLRCAPSRRPHAVAPPCPAHPATAAAAQHDAGQAQLARQLRHAAACDRRADRRRVRAAVRARTAAPAEPPSAAAG
jgi:hypothetical protein